MKNLMKLSVVLVAAALVFSSCNCFKKISAAFIYLYTLLPVSVTVQCLRGTVALNSYLFFSFWRKQRLSTIRFTVIIPNFFLIEKGFYRFFIG